MLLARQLRRTVDELLDSISSDELVDWAEMNQLFPFDARMSDLHNAHLIATLANINRDPEKRSEAYAIDDFVLFRMPSTKSEQMDDDEDDDFGAEISPMTIAFLKVRASKNVH